MNTHTRIEPAPADMISLHCGVCRSAFEVPATLAGMTSTCPQCQELIRVPAPPPSKDVQPPPNRVPKRLLRRILDRVALVVTAVVLIAIVVYVMQPSGLGTVSQVRAKLAGYELHPIDDPKPQVIRGRRLTAQSFAPDASRPFENVITVFSDDEQNVLCLRFSIQSEKSDNPASNLNWMFSVLGLAEGARISMKSILALPECQNADAAYRLRIEGQRRIQFEYITIGDTPTDATVLVRDMKLW